MLPKNPLTPKKFESFCNSLFFVNCLQSTPPSFFPLLFYFPPLPVFLILFLLRSWFPLLVSYSREGRLNLKDLRTSKQRECYPVTSLNAKSASHSLLLILKYTGAFNDISVINSKCLVTRQTSLGLGVFLPLIKFLSSRNLR